jgi:soluble cytochrome b562
MTFRVRQIGTLCVLALALTQAAFRFQQDDEKTPLGKKMAAINTAFKAVGRQIDDPAQNAATLKQLDVIETNAKEAMALDPEKKGQVPAAQQAKFVADYKAGMKMFLDTVTKLRTAVKAGNNAEASKIIDAMKDQQREGHKEFRIRKAGAPPGL